MKIIKAKILDPTHLELSQPIPVQPGEYIHISIPEEGEAWREAAKQHFLQAYDEQDALYDVL